MTSRRNVIARWSTSFSVAVLVMLAAVGCVDSPTVASPNALADSDPLAQTLDALATASANSGDLARKESFEVAALAVRSGVTASHIDVRVGSLDEEGMDGIVSAVDWSVTIAAAQRPPTRRSLVAWRRNSIGVLRVISVITPTDSSYVVSPLALGAALNTPAVYAAASAQFQDIPAQANGSLSSTTSWFATAGWAKIRQLQTTGGCPKLASNPSIGGFACEQVRYAVAFNVDMQSMTGIPPIPVSSASIAVLTPREQQVNGEHVTFSCTAPKSTRGCN